MQIMYNNGVSHVTAVNDIDGIASLVKWLSYIPKHKASKDPLNKSLAGCSVYD